MFFCGILFKLNPFLWSDSKFSIMCICDGTTGKVIYTVRGQGEDWGWRQISKTASKASISWNHILPVFTVRKCRISPCFAPTALPQSLVRPLAVTLHRNPPPPPALLPAAHSRLCAALCLGPALLLVRWAEQRRNGQAGSSFPEGTLGTGWGHQEGGNKWPGQGKGLEDSAFWS